MKSFNEKDLITWSNREKAVIGNEYYFGNCLYDIKYRIKEGIYTVLTAIDNNCYNYPFHIERTSNEVCCACILPKDALKEEKTYRPCRTIKEFSDLLDLSSPDSKNDEDYIYNLIDETIHIRSKSTNTEYYTSIRSISKDVNGEIKILITRRSYQSFEQIFNNFDIEVNGEWQPFGILN